ncbi:MAG: acetyl-CoA carboxylase biotin carboxyl carrier protein [Thermoguttaceae bacterium]|nr:acetyl-CoA carboxylase biotin carboxyl carrier protein [Thermoguttaceae bacterium]MBQ7109809.1 acetyl-CoA carboxylase biotin carboxyl carrier protein [Thermoguttaceae bacterium]
MAEKEKKEKKTPSQNASQEGVFTLEGVRFLVELMQENNVSELDWEQGDARLKLRRGAIAPVVDAIPTVVPVAAPAPTAAPAVAAPTAPQAPAEDADAKFVKTIDSPMVGTFYASPSPNAAPFVKVGDVVGPEKTVCILEAMKVFNEIQAEISGKIVAVLVKNGDPVEFGAPLFKVDVRG